MYRTKATRSQDESMRERTNREIAYRAASEGIVLLENNGALPIKTNDIALFGAGAAHTVKGGTGSGEVNERQSTSILEGLETSQISVTTKSWIDDYDEELSAAREEYRKWISERLRIPSMKAIGKVFEHPFVFPQGREITDQDIKDSNTDTCVYVITRQAGEGMDQKLDNGDHAITDVERVNLAKCAAAYEKFIVVINVGSSFDVNFFDEIPGIDALLFFAQQGSEGGRALSDILTGKVSPSGKLADTWAKRYEDIPFSDEYSYLNGNVKDENYKEGIYVGYRYFDTFDVAPYYPFGYGLSYTDFDIVGTLVDLGDGQATIQVKVTNTGAAHGKEVVQVYISCPQAGLHKSYQDLAGFAKTQTLAPGESETLTIVVNLAYLATYMEQQASFVLDQGDYIVRVGNSSRDTKPAAILELSEQVIVSKHDNICAQKAVIAELKPDKLRAAEDLTSIPRQAIDPLAFKTVQYAYGDATGPAEDRVEQIISKLSQTELVDLVMGTGTKGIFFGEGYFIAPGAVGQTTSTLTDKGLINATLADGPAGLRLQKTSAFTRKGTAKMVDATVDFLNYLPGVIKRFVFAKPDRDDLVYQYTTAFPVALALAQTWNAELVSNVGEAIGTEMLEYGIVFWLGPGMNIHRNPLCGRNFEYYSEDPFLSGKLAAAVTKGCQSVGGVYATLKHYVANNQETNRFHVSSNVSERALREIYLRGFEIAVRESAPGAIMTAYNKINDVYAPNSHDLNTKVLRNEWGFNGVVMTDWTSTRKGCADNSAAMVAGNDLLMPGGKYYKKELLRDLKAGTLSEDQVRKCARNIVRAILNSALAKEYPLSHAATK